MKIIILLSFLTFLNACESFVPQACISDKLNGKNSCLAGNVEDEDSIPVSFDDYLIVFKNSTTTVLPRSIDPKSLNLTYEVVTAPSHGSLISLDPWVYKPSQDYVGEDLINFRSFNGNSYSNSSTIKILVIDNSSINPPGTPNIPVLNVSDLSYNTKKNESLNIQVPYSGQLIFGNPSHGTIITSGSTITYTPSSDYVGMDYFTYQLKDGTNLSNLGIISIEVLDNLRPQAINEVILLESPFSGQLNAYDPEGDDLVYSITVQPSHGTLTIDSSTGAFEYITVDNESDFFKFKVFDGKDYSNEAQVTIQKANNGDNPVDPEPPVVLTCQNLSLTTGENTAVNISVQAAGSSNLTYSIVSTPVLGDLSGSNPWVYTPKLNKSGSETLTFFAQDQKGNFCFGYVSISINDSNSAPLAQNQYVETYQDESVTILLQSSDPDGDPLTYSIISNPQHGTLSLSNGVVLYTPGQSYVGTDSFTFQVNDGRLNSNVAMVDIRVKEKINENNPPVSFGNFYVVNPNENLTLDLMALDIDGDDLVYQMLSNTSLGSSSLNGKTLTYVAGPNPGIDELTFKVNDGSLDSNISKVNIRILGDTETNTPPTAIDLNYTIMAGETITLNLNATDPDVDDVLNYGLLSYPSKGVLSGVGKTLQYTANINSVGSDSFTYQVNDGESLSNVATVTINIIERVNQAPIAEDLNFLVYKNSSLNFNLIGLDTDNQELTYSLLSNPSGIISLNGNSVTYSNANPGVDTFTYQVFDGVSYSNTATVTIQVLDLNEEDNHKPISENLYFIVNSGDSVLIELKGTDLDDDNLNYTVIDQPQNGALTLVSGNSYYYSSSTPGYDVFSYKVNDGTQDSDISYVTILVVDSAQENHSPLANDKTLSTSQSVDILLTAIDIDNDPLSFTLIDLPSKGTVNLAGNTVTYTPSPGKTGADFFTFQAFDGELYSNIATVSINLDNEENHPPVAFDKVYYINKNTPIDISLQGLDIDGDSIVYSQTSNPFNGSVILNGSLGEYTPNNDFVGIDIFHYKVSDGSLDSNEASVIIHVIDTNSPPETTGANYLINKNQQKTVQLIANDPNNDTLTYSIVQFPSNGSLVNFNYPYVTYIPNNDYIGVDEFKFQVNDGSLSSNISTITLTIIEENNPPQVNNQEFEIFIGESIDFTLTGSDPDGDSLTFNVLNNASKGTMNSIGVNQYSYTGQVLGLETIQFKANDGNLDSNIGTISILIRSRPNTPPITESNNYTTDYNSPVIITLVASDAETTLNSSNLNIINSVSNGVISPTSIWNEFVYTPNNGFVGTDSLTFKANDGDLDSNISTINITVLPPANNPPQTQDLFFEMYLGESINVNLQGSDPDGDSLTFNIVQNPSKGILSYINDSNYNYESTDLGTFTFTYKANDGSLDSNISTVTILVKEKECLTEDCDINCFDVIHYAEGKHGIYIPSLSKYLQFKTPAKVNFINDQLYLSGYVSDKTDDNKKFYVDLIFSGYSSSPNSHGTKNGGGQTLPSWRFFSKLDGFLIGLKDYDGIILELSEKGPSAQFGEGANDKDSEMGFSSWFDYKVVSKPSGMNLSDGSGDINVDLLECSECFASTDNGLPYTMSYKNKSYKLVNEGLLLKRGNKLIYSAKVYRNNYIEDIYFEFPLGNKNGDKYYSNDIEGFITYKGNKREFKYTSGYFGEDVKSYLPGMGLYLTFKDKSNYSGLIKFKLTNCELCHNTSDYSGSGSHSMTMLGGKDYLGQMKLVENLIHDTAIMKGSLSLKNDHEKKFNVLSVFSELSSDPNSHGSKTGGGPELDSWYYYHNLSGLLLGSEDYSGELQVLTDRGPAFQIGEGANDKNSLFGASSWFNHSSKEGNLSSGTGDFNLELNPCSNGLVDQCDYNYIKNGSFEEIHSEIGLVNNKTLSNLNTWDVYAFLPHWNTVFGSGIEVHKTYNVTGESQDGSFHVELDSHHNSTLGNSSGSVDSAMEQKVLLPEGTFHLNFYYKARTHVPNENIIKVYIDGALKLTLTGEDYSWKKYRVEFENSSEKEVSIKFQSFGENYQYGGLLDNVSLYKDCSNSCSGGSCHGGCKDHKHNTHKHHDYDDHNPYGHHKHHD